MGQMVVLSAEEVSKVLTIEDAIAAVEEAYRQKATGKGVAWPMVYEQFEPGVADMDIRSGELAGSGLFGLKLTAWFSQNPKKGLPEIFGTTLLCDNATGEPLALLNASAVTGLRTGAAAALGAKWLARAMHPNCLLRARPYEHLYGGGRACRLSQSERGQGVGAGFRCRARGLRRAHARRGRPYLGRLRACSRGIHLFHRGDG